MHQLLKIHEVMEMTRLSRSKIYAMEAAKKFPAKVKIGGSTYWRARVVQEWMDALGQQQGPESDATADAPDAVVA
jgi:predicted DNA-binding transcriptional regulator AlpA